MADYMLVEFEKSGQAVMEIESGRVTRYLDLDGNLLFDVAPLGDGCSIVEKYIKFTPRVEEVAVEAEPVDPKAPPVVDQSERVKLLEARLSELIPLLQRLLDERYDSARMTVEAVTRLTEIRNELGA